MNKLLRLKPRVKILSDFYVWDTETGIDVEYSVIATRERKTGIQWLLHARPEAFKFGVIYGRNYTKVIHSLDELKETFKEPRFKKKHVFAHNSFYDITNCWGSVYTLDPEAI